MMRPAAIEIALFLAPFVVYFLYLWATRAGIVHPAAWPLPVVAVLTAAALVLVLVGFALITHFSGVPPGAEYEPAHLEGGRLVPGTVR
jgi:hypothetical protein